MQQAASWGGGSCTPTVPLVSQVELVHLVYSVSLVYSVYLVDLVCRVCLVYSVYLVGWFIWLPRLFR